MDTYKIDFANVDKILNDLKQIRNSYNEQIVCFSNLIKEISSSNQWKDIVVKTEFINTLNSYLKIYKEASSFLEQYEKYLTSKVKMAYIMEQKYTR